jgi:hypothetical protein
MNLSELIGLSITEIRYDYTFTNKYDMQEFFLYLKLSNGLIIEIPQYYDLEINENSELNEAFINAKNTNNNCSKLIENQKIIDFHFWFYEKESDEEKKAYLELESGIYITEENYGPIGLTNIDLEILTKSEFDKLKAELIEGFEIKSYSTELKNVC